jgi:heme-degrading monooxygenase HmoA
MITRVFRVKVPLSLHQEFECKFRAISIPAVEAQPGFVSVFVGRPIQFAPEEFVMISTWQNEQSIRDFAGGQWNQAVIPEGMEQFVAECWVHHYEIFG